MYFRKDSNTHFRIWFKFISVELVLLCFRFNLSVETNWSEGEITFYIALPLLAIYFTFRKIPYKFFEKILPGHSFIAKWETPSRECWLPDDREFCIAIHDNSLWWHFWTDTNEWHSGIPWYRDGSFDFIDFILGNTVFTSIKIEDPKQVFIPMPEGSYQGILKVEEHSWKKKRWPWWPFSIKKVIRDISVDGGIPFSGKGENSWDCGKDGLFATGFETKTDEDAIGKFVGIVLTYRRKRGDKPDYGMGTVMTKEKALS